MLNTIKNKLGSVFGAGESFCTSAAEFHRAKSSGNRLILAGDCSLSTFDVDAKHPGFKALGTVSPSLLPLPGSTRPIQRWLDESIESWLVEHEDTKVYLADAAYIKRGTGLAGIVPSIIVSVIDTQDVIYVKLFTFHRFACVHLTSNRIAKDEDDKASKYLQQIKEIISDYVEKSTVAKRHPKTRLLLHNLSELDLGLIRGKKPKLINVRFAGGMNRLSLHRKTVALFPAMIAPLLIVLVPLIAMLVIGQWQVRALDESRQTYNQILQAPVDQLPLSVLNGRREFIEQRKPPVLADLTNSIASKVASIEGVRTEAILLNEVAGDERSRVFTVQIRLELPINDLPEIQHQETVARQLSSLLGTRIDSDLIGISRYGSGREIAVRKMTFSGEVVIENS